MIELATWLSGIGRMSEFIGDDISLRRVWVRGDSSITSIVSYDELYEQLFDDLDSDAFEAELERHLPRDLDARVAINSFLDAIRKFDKIEATDPNMQSPTYLLSSSAWKDVQDAARRVLQLDAVKRAFRSKEN
jgi:hypothetical protein